ncbi:MAG: ATP synthase F1 subunit gamma [Lachnospiraceae bacterium]|nr:ATP synthase F1 subunit gamma [Lachnospiraceae bacterium]
MAGIKEIKNKIESVSEIQKITNAMYLVASVKLRRAREALNNTKPYFDALKGEISVMFSNIENVESVNFLPEGVTEDNDTPLPGKYAYLIITADKGLCGEYNHRVIREAEKLIKEHDDNLIFVVGENGRAYFSSHGYPVDENFNFTAQNPTVDRARMICDEVAGRFEAGEFSKIYLVYTEFGNGMNSKCISKRLLPLHRAHFDEIPGESENMFEFVPSVEKVLENVIRNYVVGYVYSALVESYCSEQNARMSAMNSANNNAAEMLETLRLQHNHARQDEITQEITEISSGANALKVSSDKR